MRKVSLLSMMLIVALFVVACAPMPAAEPSKAPAAAAPATAVPAPEPTKAPAAPAAAAPAAKDIVDTAVADGRFKTLVAAAQAAGLVDTLKGKGPFTVFAPSDDAFAKLPAGTVDALLKDPAKLKDILLYHVVAGNVMAADAAKLNSANTVQGQPITIKVDGNKVMINDALVTIADIKTSNGVIHVIDKVILPPAPKAAEPTKAPAAAAPAAKDIVDTAVADGRFKTLVAAAQAAGLVETLKGTGPFTVFAPSDDAFAKLPAGTVEALLKDPAKLKDILLYHVVAGNVMAADAAKLTSAKTVQGQPLAIKADGNKVMINDAIVTIADIKTSNGVIHVVDKVILPPAAAAPAAKDIVDTAVADGRFKTLVAAVQAAGLVDTLKGKGPFTVFAPSDDAFAKLPAGTVEALLKDPAKLKDILLYHVVAGNVMAADAAKLTSADTVLGKPIMIKVKDGKVMINDATVVIPDVKAGNGVIHVIDSVMLPPSK